MSSHSVNIHDRASAVYAQPDQPLWSQHREPAYNELQPGFQQSLTINTSRNQYPSLRPNGMFYYII